MSIVNEPEYEEVTYETVEIEMAEIELEFLCNEKSKYPKDCCHRFW